MAGFDRRGVLAIAGCWPWRALALVGWGALAEPGVCRRGVLAMLGMALAVGLAVGLAVVLPVALAAAGAGRGGAGAGRGGGREGAG